MAKFIWSSANVYEEPWETPKDQYTALVRDWTNDESEVEHEAVKWGGFSHSYPSLFVDASKKTPGDGTSWANAMSLEMATRITHRRISWVDAVKVLKKDKFKIRSSKYALVQDVPFANFYWGGRTPPDRVMYFHFGNVVASRSYVGVAMCDRGSG